MQCEGSRLSGYTENTPDNLQLDSGIILRNFNPETESVVEAIAAGKMMGATQGGSTFAALAEIRKIDVDGVFGDAKGLKANDGWAASIKFSMLEVTSQIIKDALAFTESLVLSATHEIIQARTYICNDDYIDNITYVGRVAGTTERLYIQLFNVLNQSGLTLTSADKSQGLVPMDFMAHYDSTNLDNPPFKIYYPKAEGTISGIATDGDQAQGTQTLDTQPTAGDTMTIGTKVYTFTGVGDDDANGEISIGADLAGAQANVVAAVNGTDDHNSANTLVTIGNFAANDAIITAIVPGTTGNSIVTTETFTAPTNIFDAATLGTTKAGSGTVLEGVVASVVVGDKTLTDTTLADGTFMITSVPYSNTGTTYTVTATGTGITGSAASIVVTAGEDTDAGVIKLA